MTDSQLIEIIRAMPAFSQARIAADRRGVELVQSVKADNESELCSAILSRWALDCAMEVKCFPGGSWLLIVTSQHYVDPPICGDLAGRETVLKQY